MVTVATRGTVVIADWEALPVAEALSPEAVPEAPEIALRAGFRMVRAAEGEAVAPEARVDSTSGVELARVAWWQWRERTLALALGVADGLTSLFSIASLLGAVADTVGPVGLGAEAGLVTSRAGELGVGDQVHVVDA